jgi:hypothetical protein
MNPFLKFPIVNGKSPRSLPMPQTAVDNLCRINRGGNINTYRTTIKQSMRDNTSLVTPKNTIGIGKLNGFVKLLQWLLARWHLDNAPYILSRIAVNGSTHSLKKLLRFST